MKKPTSMKSRIESIDLLRGFVMIIMTLDHVRDYFHFGYEYANPTDLTTTTPAIFITRWVTHFCAPVFIFLAGTSAFLYSYYRSSTRSDLSIFLFTRGIWLVLLEITIVSFGWYFDITFSIQTLQTIWAIGISMLLMSVIVYLPTKIILFTGITIIAGHNLLDSIHVSEDTPFAFLWYMLHEPHRLVIKPEQHFINLIYPIIPWVGVMMTGYVFGSIYKNTISTKRRKFILLLLGSLSVLLFLILRIINIYGDPTNWSRQHNFIFTILSFINITKYPPSLLFLLITIGPALFFLAIIENWKGKLFEKITIFGRVPLFYYIIHIYVIHILGILGVIIQGLPAGSMIYDVPTRLSGFLANYGFNLWVVYIVWLGVVIGLYPLCKWFSSFKMKNKNKWWVSYV